MQTLVCRVDIVYFHVWKIKRFLITHMHISSLSTDSKCCTQSFVKSNCQNTQKLLRKVATHIQDQQKQERYWKSLFYCFCTPQISICSHNSPNLWRGPKLSFSSFHTMCLHRFLSILVNALVECFFSTWVIKNLLFGGSLH